MDLAIPQEPRVLQPGYKTQDALLIAISQVILKSDEVVRVRAQIFLAQLHHRVRLLTGAGIFESDGLHGPEAQGVTATASDLLDGQAAFKVIQVLPLVTC